MTNPRLILADLEHSRARLAYYLELQEQESIKAAGAPKKRSVTANPYDKWVEIYTDRLKKLQQHAQKLGIAVEKTLH